MRREEDNFYRPDEEEFDQKEQFIVEGLRQALEQAIVKFFGVPPGQTGNIMALRLITRMMAYYVIKRKSYFGTQN